MCILNLLEVISYYPIGTKEIVDIQTLSSSNHNVCILVLSYYLQLYQLILVGVDSKTTSVNLIITYFLFSTIMICAVIVTGKEEGTVENVKLAN